jgi:hypothetical protein
MGGVSEEWLHMHRQREGRDGVSGPDWSWPLPAAATAVTADTGPYYGNQVTEREDAAEAVDAAPAKKRGSRHEPS